MSGGSLNYAYSKVECIARDVAECATKPLHKAFAKHLLQVAKALHALEWMLSCDTAEGSEDALIRAVMHPQFELLETIAAAEKARDELIEIINRTTPKC